MNADCFVQRIQIKSWQHCLVLHHCGQIRNRFPKRNASRCASAIAGHSFNRKVQNRRTLTPHQLNKKINQQARESWQNRENSFPLNNRGWRQRSPAQRSIISPVGIGRTG
ncbi:MAG: hypothetical protein CBB71_05160 [Rhodopirellula sp. TMED11]|nr:MAG: hypothetical protein CBB71_05160 [Rhodopirellula sp. TMED11]